MARPQDIADIEARRLALSGRLAFLPPNMMRARQLRAEQRRLTALALRMEAGKAAPAKLTSPHPDPLPGGEREHNDRTRWWDR